MKFSNPKGARMSKRHFESREGLVKRIKLYLQIFRVLGMFANEIANSQLKRCRRPFYIIFVLWVCIYVAYIIFLSLRFTTIAKIDMRLMVELTKHLVGYVSLSANTIVTYSSQNYFIKYFDLLQNYDNGVARMKKGRRDNLWVPRIVTLSMTAVNLLLLTKLVTSNSTGILFDVIVSDLSTQIMHICGTLEKFLFLYLLLERFKHLNRKIVPCVSWDETRRDPYKIKILDVKKLHSVLYSAQQSFCDIYNKSLLIWFASLMIHIIANVRIIREKGMLMACFFVGPSILQLLILCAICHCTAEEGNKIACILSENMCVLVNSGETTEKVGVFMYFLHNRLSFDAMGVFTIDLPLFQSIIAVITTYFIILM